MLVTPDHHATGIVHVVPCSHTVFKINARRISCHIKINLLFCFMSSYILLNGAFLILVLQIECKIHGI